MSNYPDDIRQYDDDPRSPFFLDPTEPVCGTCGHYILDTYHCTRFGHSADPAGDACCDFEERRDDV